MVLVLAGIAGMMSAISTNSYSARVTWEFVSVHLFALEGYNLLHRNHDYEGVKCFSWRYLFLNRSHTGLYWIIR
jgi:hypothetical protein